MFSSHRPGAASRRDLWILAGVFALMVAGLGALAAATGWDDTWEAIARITGAQLALLLILSLVNYLARGLRWHVFARRLGLGTGLLQNLRHFMGGFALSATPGRVGELVRMRWIARETGWSFERSAPLVLIDRGADLVAMALILGAAIGLAAGGITGAVPLVITALLTAYIATHPQLLRGLADLTYRLTGRLARLLVRVRRAARSLAAFRGPWTLALATALGLVGWLAEGYALHLLLVWLGAGIDPWMAIAIFIFATLVGGLTGAPGGVGGAEAVMIALLTLEGVPLTAAIPATLVIRLTTLWFAIVIGLLVFPFAERLSARPAHANAPA